MQASKLPDALAQNIESYCETRAFTHGLLEKESPIYKQIYDMNNQFLSMPQRKGGMGQKEKVLALLSIHATHGTEQSVDFAVTAAMQIGASQEEIMDALDLALLTGGGAAVARVQLAAAVLAGRVATIAQKPRLLSAPVSPAIP
ncbi:MAG: carboxymuconolactone decarboxylase family protein [Polyangiaceae bacterium]|nr:carboxymuconolactone decarboxylase family protein [Polyangiaceae bacterium]